MKNGGIIGPINTPTVSITSGVWNSMEQYNARVNEIWPIASSYPSYNRSYTLTIDATKISSTLTDYPIKVLLQDENFGFPQSLSSGLDIVFTNTSNVLLNFEMVYFDSTNKIAEYHVKIPSVSSSTDTEFYMYVGEASVSTSPESPTDVWGGNYILVCHMDSSLTDSTSNGYDGTNSSSTFITDELGIARSLALTDYIHFGDESDYGLQTGTVQLVFKPDNNPTTAGYNRLISADPSNYGLGSMNWDHSGGTSYTQSFQVNDGAWKTRKISSTIPTTEYSLLTARSTGTSFTALFNGVQEGTSLTIGTIKTTTGNFTVGTDVAGDVSELRISDTNRSDDWIAADYYNLVDLSLLDISEDDAVINTFDDATAIATWDDYYGTVQTKTADSKDGFTGLTAETQSWGESSKSYDCTPNIDEKDWSLEFGFYTYENTAQSIRIIDTDGTDMIKIDNYDWLGGGNTRIRIYNSSGTATTAYTSGTYLSRTTSHTMRMARTGDNLNGWVDGTQVLTDYDLSSFSFDYTSGSKIRASVHKNSTGVTTDAMVGYCRFSYNT